MSKESWTTLIVVFGLVITVAAIAAVLQVRPRRQLLIPFAAAFLLSTLIYATSTHSAGSFHRNIVISALGASAIGFLAPTSEPKGEGRLANLVWALFGIVAPVLLFIGLLSLACWGKENCLS